MKRHSEFILAFDDAALDGIDKIGEGISHYPFEDFLLKIQQHAVLRERASLEANPSYRQIIPYVVLRKPEPGQASKYFLYRRGKGVGETRLLGNASVGVGGHIDMASLCFEQESVPNLRATIFNSAYRELCEEIKEVGYTGSGHLWARHRIQFSDLYIKLDHDVHGVHFGVLMMVDLPVTVDLACAEPALEPLGFFTAQQILTECNVPLEDWTRVFLEWAAAGERPKMPSAESVLENT